MSHNGSGPSTSIADSSSSVTSFALEETGSLKLVMPCEGYLLIGGKLFEF